MSADNLCIKNSGEAGAEQYIRLPFVMLQASHLHTLRLYHSGLDVAHRAESKAADEHPLVSTLSRVSSAEIEEQYLQHQSVIAS